MAKPNVKTILWMLDVNQAIARMTPKQRKGLRSKMASGNYYARRLGKAPNITLVAVKKK